MSCVACASLAPKKKTCWRHPAAASSQTQSPGWPGSRALLGDESVWLRAGYPSHAAHLQVAIPGQALALDFGCGCGSVLQLVPPDALDLRALDSSVHTQSHAGHRKMKLPTFGMSLGDYYACSCGQKLYLTLASQMVASLGTAPSIQHPLPIATEVMEVSTGKVWLIAYWWYQPPCAYDVIDQVVNGNGGLGRRRIPQADFDSGKWVVVP